MSICYGFNLIKFRRVAEQRNLNIEAKLLTREKKTSEISSKESKSEQMKENVDLMKKSVVPESNTRIRDYETNAKKFAKICAMFA